MIFSLLLPSPLAHDYYSLFYLLGFGAAGALLLWEGLHRRYPLRSWLLLVAGTLLLLILGTKLITISWLDGWQHRFELSTGQRSVLGGMLGATLGVALLRRWLGFGRDAYDAFALPFLLGLAVQGLGCLLTGCCFGIRAAESWPWGVCYAPGTLPFLTQVAKGQLAAAAAHSLPVHAAQLYQIGLCLSIGAALGLTRYRQWPAKSRLVLAFALYVAGRCVLENWRDPLGDVLGAGEWQQLKPVQLGLGLAALGLGAYFLYLVRYSKAGPGRAAIAPASRPGRTLAGAAALLGFTAVLGPEWLVLPEQWVVKSLLLPVIGLEVGCWLWGSAQSRRYQVAPAGLILLCGLLTSQAPAPPDSSASRTSRAYTSVHFGGTGGQAEQYFEAPEYGCSGTTFPISTYQQRYATASLGISRTLPLHNDGTITFEVHAALGGTHFRPLQDTIILINHNRNYAPSTALLEQNTARLYAFSPYVEYSDAKNLRVGLGFHVGSLAYDYPYKPGTITQATPQLLIEVGKLSTLYFHSSAYYGLQGLGNGTATLGAGTGFGRDNIRLLVGVAVPNSKLKGVKGADTGTAFGLGFVQASFQAAQRWQLKPFLATNFDDVYQFSVQTSYRLSGKNR
ncbi:Prolipoprotein diacylglyceryltransferase [Hymenobacter daecheongensis DSM 21074]|uniref:Prolipoprotein diacylglyceryltransferase n=1 Tax=Hymenobacter daecheongensis DSM 21074 TaxID=1121955 RepID=A0A1M6KHZ3_9BACT|nr:prolipoprotein diacylglyceryl transferase family protein [Hymenobacter daecheongensis]SHJ58567.1 Prolipoprotein diacylglyceryltransferase [Hymenobacter daecheongensis DSM 21074]